MLALDLGGRVAFVAGGARGIGGAVTETLARAGAHVVFTHRGSPGREDAVADLLSRIRQGNGHAEAIVADATVFEEMLAAVGRAVERQGKVDILVHNVGANLVRPVETSCEEEWRQQVDVNLTSAYFSVRAVLPHMLKSGYGRVILIGSSVVYDGGGGAIDYAAAKAGLVGMMKYLCRAYARKGILANVVHPCVIDTDLLRARYDDGAKRNQLLSQVPAGRLGKPEDIAGLVAFLVSTWGDFICGQEILVDGGRTFFR